MRALVPFASLLAMSAWLFSGCAATRNPGTGVNGNIVYSAGLSNLTGPGPDESGKVHAVAPRSDSASFTVHYNPVDYWYGRVTFTGYTHPNQKQPWNPDFTYGFGYSDWHPGSVSVTYENYGGNRLRPSGGAPMTRFQEGTVSANYKLPEAKVAALKAFHLSTSVQLTPRYFDLASLEDHSSKSSMSVDLHWTIYGNWYAGTKFSYYPVHGQQQPWDPDFTYCFGYSDWHPGTWSLEYTNFAPNRLPSHAPVAHPGTFRDGSLVLSYGWSLPERKKK
ncbi:MAG TPA: hypothetical protein VNN08_13345 [Thermoanaerobaculia bacterium]|nr:hypothetical protein [Thermoanaerobaculia bacterium]